MIVHEVEQGSREWSQLRLGIPTASCFDMILTPKTLKPSASQDKYLAKLIGEWSTGESLDSATSQFMERGRILEQEAINWYEWEHGKTIRRVGFITNDEGTIGCSPDGLEGDDGGIEIKCLSLENHAAALIKPDLSDHKCQIQGSIYIAERKFWTRIYYHPNLPKLVVPIQPDLKFIDILKAELTAFVAKLEAAKARIIDMGFDNSQSVCPCGSRSDLQLTEFHGVKCGACRAKLEEAEKAMFG